MHFTEQDFRKIRDWLLRHSIKDTQFPNANPVTGKETIAIVQDGENRNITVSELLNITPTPDPDPKPTPTPELNLSIKWTYPTSVVEYPANGSMSSAYTVKAVICNDGKEIGEDFTDISFIFTRAYSYSDGTKPQPRTETYTKSSVSVTDVFSKPGTCLYSISSVKLKYQNVEYTVSNSSITCTCIRPSFIGYFNTVEDFDTTKSDNIKVLKTSVAGTYNVTNSTNDFAHLIVGIPNDGSVKDITSITQLTTVGINVPQTVVSGTTEDSIYKLFYTSTRHKQGITYTFKIE